MTAVVVVRHAQSVWNASSRWQGHADPPLSADGEAQAARASWEGALVVSSDLSRARRTAELLNRAGAAMTVEPGLREYDVGAWSGLTREEIAGRWPDELARFDAGTLDRPPGGEDRHDFDRRVADASRRVAQSILGSGTGQVLVVTHGGVIRSMLRQTQGRDRHISHLCGFAGEATDAGLVPFHPVDLLESDGSDDGHRAEIPSGP